MKDILQEIVAHKRAELELMKSRLPERELRSAVASPEPRGGGLRGVRAPAEIAAFTQSHVKRGGTGIEADSRERCAQATSGLA